jgi:hypothetical protein
MQWYEEYAYIGEFGGSACNFDTCSGKFIEAWLFYRSQMNRYAQLQQAKMSSKSDGLGVLKQSYMSRGG